ncbi:MULTISPECIES: hypothetical protein [Bacillus]|uniref:hypothetical protein n=1 Tax=Bacillus TaxID=1386 RepID=UPI0002E20552|nr:MULTISPECIES: hypothetical protein [Bacillus]
MKLNELTKILKSTGYPVAYSHFSTAQKTPFICYKEAYSSNFIADNKVYRKTPNIDIELYTSKKDLVAEETLERLLDDHEIPYQTIETFIESENVFQRIYEIQL